MKKSLPSQPKWVNKVVLVFLAVFTFILYINLGRDALFDWDEGIYAELGRELLLTKQLFVTYWNNATWFEKPPGIAWLSGLGQLIAGHSALGARLFQPLVATLVLYMVYLIGRKLKSWRTGLLATAILGGFNLFLGRTRAVNTDMPLLLGITSMVAALLYQKKPFIIALIAALSIWFKGVAGTLPLLISAPLFLTKDKKYLLQSFAYSLLLILPWHLYAYLRYGEVFLTPYIREQVITRATTQIEFHFESRYFYFKYLYENLGLGVLLVSGVGAVLSLKDKKLLPTWWVLLPLGIFTLAKTRLFWYILPVYPGLALLAAYAVDYFSSFPKAKFVVSVIVVFALLQSLLTAYRSVEPNKKVVMPPDRIDLVTKLSKISDHELLILVPPTERTAEAILPESQRISSSFRYGGMPSVVFYYEHPVNFFYNVDKFKEALAADSNSLAVIYKDDAKLLPSGYKIIEESGDYRAITKGVYAQR